VLHVDAREGSYPGLVAQRRLDVKLVDAAGRRTETRTVTYCGEATTLRFSPPRRKP
jgi:hypothetical protein